MTTHISFRGLTLLVLVATLWALSSCASSQTSMRKCNGKKAIRTPMGPM